MRKKLYKSGKNWVIASTLALTLLAGANAVEHTHVHAAIQPRTTAQAKQPTTNVGNQANNLHKAIINNSSKVNTNSAKDSKVSSSNLKTNSGTSASNSDSNALTPNYIEDHAHYNLGSYNARQPQSTENQKEAYTNYLKQNPQLANLYNETANQSNSNPIASSKGASNAPKDNVSASSIASNSSVSSVSANNSKVSSANQISDKKNKPLMKVGLTSQLKSSNNDTDIPPFESNNVVANGSVIAPSTAKWSLDKNGTLLIHDGTYGSQTANNDPDAWGLSGYLNNSSNIINKIKYIRFSNVNLPGAFQFSSVPNVKVIDFSGINPSSPSLRSHTHFSHANYWNSVFENDSNLTTINFGHNLDTSHITADTGSFFANDTSLKNLIGFSDLNWSNVIDVNDWFNNDISLSSLDLSNFNTSAAIANSHGAVGNGLSDFIVGCTNLQNLKLGSKSILTSQAINGDPSLSYAQNENSGQPFGEDLVQLADGQPHPGTFQVFHGKGGQYSNNTGSALWALGNNGTLYIENGSLDVSPNQSNFHDWSKVKKIIYHNITGSTNANLPQQMNDIIGDKNKTNNIQNNAFIKQDTNAENAVNNDIKVINSADNYIENHGADSGDSAVAHAENADNDANNAFSDIEAQSANATANAISTLNSEVNTDQQYIDWVKGSEASLNSAGSADTWVSNNSNSATNAESWVAHNSQSESNASGKASDNSNSIGSLVSGLNAGNASATIQNAINSAVSTVETSANGALGDKATTAQISSLFNSGSGTISSVASTVANSLAGSLASVYETQNAANSKANSSDITNLTKSGGTIDSVASSYASSIATNYASSAVNWVNSYGSNASKAGSWYANNSGKLTSMVNSASSIYADASSAEASLGEIKTNSDDISALNSQINSASGLTSQISSLSKEIGSVPNGSNLASELSGDYTTLNNDINGNTGIKSQIDNLKDNTAITFTFKGANSDTIPATMTNSYIKHNGKHLGGNTYDITNLLNEEVASKSKHVVGTYTITLGQDKAGVATLSFNSNNTQNSLNKTAKLSAGIPVNDNMNTFTLGTPNQQRKAWNFVQYGLNNPKGLILGASSPRQIPASTDTAHNVVLANNQAEYEGTITLNFGSGKNAKSTTLSFDTGSNNSKVLASDSVNLLNYAKGAKNANNPSDFTKDNLINGFDTTGFKFIGATGNPYNFTIQPSDATNQTGADVHSDYNITLNYTAQPVTEKINYEYKNSKNSLVNEGSTTTSASDDTSSAWTTSSGASAGWELSNTSTPFTYTNSGSVNVMVKPMPASVTVNYINQKGNNVGTQTFNGNDYRASAAGSNSINVTSANDTSLASGYNLNSTNNNFSYNNSSVSVSVTGHDLTPASPITPDNSTNPSDANNNHSGKDMPKPSPKDNNVLFTINVQDWNSDGTQTLGNIYTKYATETGDIGGTFTINPQDYLTYGFNMKSTKKGSVSDKSITGTIGDTQLQPNSTIFNFYAKPYDKNAKIDPTDPTTPKPITVQYVGELNGQSNQVVKTYKDTITGATGTTGKLSDIEKVANVPQGYTVNTNQKYNDYKYTINTVANRVLTVYLNSETAKQMNNGGKTYTPTTPSNNPSSKVPSDSTIKKDASHGFATIIINENINGKSAHQSAQTVDKSNLGVGDGYTIEPTSFTPHGYQVDSNDKALTGTVNPDGSLSNDSATFTYDVNSNEIAPISITYYNQYGDLIDKTTGKSKLTGDNNVTNADATVIIQPNQLATKGAVGDYVDITGLLTAPKGHHFNKDIIDSSNNNLDHIQLQKANGNKPVHMNLTLFATMPTPKPTSNSNITPASASAEINSATTSAAKSASVSASNAIQSMKSTETSESVSNSLASASITNETSTLNSEAQANINTSSANSSKVSSLQSQEASESVSVASASESIANALTNLASESNALSNSDINIQPSSNKSTNIVQPTSNSNFKQNNNISNPTKTNSDTTATNTDYKPSNNNIPANDNASTPTINNSVESPVEPITFGSSEPINNVATTPSIQSNSTNNNTSSKLPQTNEANNYVGIMALVTSMLSLGLAGVDLKRKYSL